MEQQVVVILQGLLVPEVNQRSQSEMMLHQV